LERSIASEIQRFQGAREHRGSRGPLGRNFDAVNTFYVAVRNVGKNSVTELGRPEQTTNEDGPPSTPQDE
jgi:hypothetical protein